jgi:hypothetical protein
VIEDDDDVDEADIGSRMDGVKTGVDVTGSNDSNADTEWCGITSIIHHAGGLQIVDVVVMVVRSRKVPALMQSEQ